MYSIFRAAITKCHRLSGLNIINLCSHSSESLRSNFGSLLSPEDTLLGLQIVVFSLCPHMDFSLCVSLVSLLLLIRAPAIRLGHTLMTSFHLNYLFKGSVSKYSHIGGNSFNVWIWGGHISVNNNQPNK